MIMILYKSLYNRSDAGNGVGETLHFRQQYLKQNWKFSDVSTEFLDMKYSNKQSAAV